MPEASKIKAGRQSHSHRSRLRIILNAILTLLIVMAAGACAFTDALGHYVDPAGSAGNIDPILEQTGTPRPTPTPTELPCRETTGKVTKVSFESDELQDEFVASVYTPPCYDPGDEEYPVLYLLHGQNQDDEFWFDLGIADLADQAINSGRKPFLIVSPYEADAFAPVTESKFGSAFVDEMIPFIERNYSVCPYRTCRAIGGISHGGGWAVHIALLHLDLFSSVGAHSLGYFAGDSNRIARLRDTISPDLFPRFYVDRGESDYLFEEVDALDRVLTNYAILHEYQVSPGSHADSYWREHVSDYLLWYMDGWDPIP